MTANQVWAVVRESSADLAKDAFGVPVVARSEWVRVFLGRSFTFSQVNRDGSGVEYLVFGSCSQAATASERLRTWLDADFATLETLVERHRALVRSAETRPDSAILVRAYATLRHINVPTDPLDWLVTDEGLAIVRWGLSSIGRPILSWTSKELQEQKEAILRNNPHLRPATVSLPPRPASALDVAAAIGVDVAAQMSRDAKVVELEGRVKRRDNAIKEREVKIAQIQASLDRCLKSSKAKESADKRREAEQSAEVAGEAVSDSEPVLKRSVLGRPCWLWAVEAVIVSVALIITWRVAQSMARSDMPESAEGSLPVSPTSPSNPTKSAPDSKTDSSSTKLAPPVDKTKPR
jgi:hypothetical protein